MFDRSVYRARRQKLFEEMENGIIFLQGNTESPRNFADNLYPFRQDSTFLYFTGLDCPGLNLLIDAESGEETLFGQDLNIDQIVWTGRLPTISEKAESSGIEKVEHVGRLYDRIEKIRKQQRKIHFLPPYRTENIVFLSELFALPVRELAGLASRQFVQAVINQRQYKSAQEIEEIEKAVNASVLMHEAAMKYVRPGLIEQDVVAEVTRVAIQSAGNLAFPVIGTINGQTLHNHDYSNVLREGQLFLLDAGAETAMGYAGDLSSTLPVSKTFSLEQREIYEVCLAAHDQAIEMLKPGISFKSIYYQAAKTIFDGMKELGLARGNTEDALACGAHAMFFPCGLGHMMGLDVHDMENLGEDLVGWDGEPRSEQFGVKSLRLGKRLEPGFVLTIEPGIYFIPELIDLWDQQNINREYLNFSRLEKFKTFGGIRNEEDFLITESGKRLLGKPKPKSMDEVEAMRSM